jgi:hypothetical protein
MANRHGENYLPFFNRGKALKVKTPNEVKMRILKSADV